MAEVIKKKQAAFCLLKIGIAGGWFTWLIKVKINFN